MPELPQATAVLLARPRTAQACGQAVQVLFGGVGASGRLAPTLTVPSGLTAGLPTRGGLRLAAKPVLGKDLQVNGLSSTGTFALNTANATRCYKLTAAQLAATPYATASANAIGTLLYQNPASAGLGTPAVGDVLAVRLRGTVEVLLLRILALKPSTSGGVGRIRFEYRSL